MKDWKGRTVCCIASGPSLTVADVAAVKDAGLPVVAVNNAWRLAPFCDVLYAADRKWWQKYHEQAWIPAERWTNSYLAAQEFRLQQHAAPTQNSGVLALRLAAYFGASRILLLGYDCQLTGGQTHFHGDHEQGLGNPTKQRTKVWQVQFTRAACELKKKAEIINCSRQTALQCFPRATLEDALCRTSSSSCRASTAS